MRSDAGRRMTEFVVSEAGAERIPDLAALWESLGDHHSTLDDVPAVRPAADRWERRQRQYRDWLAERSGRLFIAERGGQLVGYLMMTIGDGPATWEVGDRVAEVETMAVLPSERSGGAGTALIDAALAAAEAAGVKAIAVGVVHSNAGAIRFYERAGFQPFYVEMLRYRA
jgi:ribosomal protein S18 acetylase RimI-like enzyme